MFVRNSTSLDVSLARGRVSDEMAIATAVVSWALHVQGDRLTPVTEPQLPNEGDPPDDIARLALWMGVSITACGSAAGPAGPPFVRPVVFRIGAAERRLIVFGDRRWQRRFGGALEASAPAPFERIEINFKRAFGGGYEVPPGLLPGTDLPHPGMRVVYQLNPDGVGYHPDGGAATGALLPNVERPDQLLRNWNDTPEPAGFTPCRDLVSWRMRDEARATAERYAAAEDAPALLRGPPPLRVYHHAPPSLIFDDVPPGTHVELQGLGVDPVRFVVPLPPARVSVRARKAEQEIHPKLRALHVDAERRIVRLVFGHSFRYDPRRAPGWVRVTAAPGGAA
jgi:hypothetical protein